MCRYAGDVHPNSLIEFNKLTKISLYRSDAIVMAITSGVNTAGGV